MAALQGLLPALVTVLHRGRDNTLVFAALEACALLGGLQVLLPFQEAVLGGLLRSVAALEAALASASAVEPAGKGVLPAECELAPCRMGARQLAITRHWLLRFQNSQGFLRGVQSMRECP